MGNFATIVHLLFSRAISPTCSRNITVLFISILFFLTANPVFAERGRVIVQNGTVRTEYGDLLRGCHAHTLRYIVENAWSDQQWWDDLASKGKMNVVRMLASIDYWKGDCEPMTMAKMKERLDIAVDRAAKAGVYVIIDDHSQCCGSDFEDYELGKTFWREIAPRYADRTHVIYEIKNEPRDAGNSAVVQYMKDCYAIIRQHAPNTHVLIFSHSAASPELVTDVQKSRQGDNPIDYSNASVAFHGYYNKGDFQYALQIKNSGVPVICTEFDSNYGSGDNTAFINKCENNGISWVWLFDNRDLPATPRTYCDCGSVATSVGDNDSDCRINMRQTGFNPSKFNPFWPADPNTGSSNCTLTLSKTGHSFSAGAGNTTVTVTTGESFTAGDDRDWITVSKNGNDVSITVTENTGADSRSGTVTISGCSNKTITITQAGQGSTGGSGNCGTGEASFIQSAGEVVIEAENFNDNKQQNDQVQWQTGSSQGGYSGSGYVYVEDGSTNNNNGDVPDNTRLTYNIEFTGGGTYTIWIRRWAPDGAGNSVFATLGGIQSSGTDNAADEGVWTWKSLGTVNLSGAGVYVLELIRREDGYLADKIVINSGEQPSGEGPDETNCVTTNFNKVDLQELIHIYPNPVNDRVIIEIENQSSNVVLVELTNYMGQLVQTLQNNQKEKQIVLNVAALPQGLYHVVLHTNNKKVVKKILVSK